MKSLLKRLYYVPLAVLVFIYLMHGLLGFTGSEEFYEIVEVLGFSGSITALLVFMIGPLDTTVALILVFKNKIIPSLTWGYLYLWVGLWPWVPRAMEWYGGMEPEYIEALIVTITASIAYYCHNKLSSR